MIEHICDMQMGKRETPPDFLVREMTFLPFFEFGKNQRRHNHLFGPGIVGFFEIIFGDITGNFTGRIIPKSLCFYFLVSSVLLPRF